MNAGFYGVKILSIVIVSIVYVILGTALSILLDQVITDEDPQQKSTHVLFSEIALMFGLIAVLYYGMRLFVKNMPFILDGMYGFHYSMLKETSGGIIIAYILFTYQNKLQAMLLELRSRITNAIHAQRM
jgi:hypothetical protein